MVKETDESGTDWSNDQHNNRTVRITAREAEEVTIFPDDVRLEGGSCDSSFLGRFNLDERDNSDYCYGLNAEKDTSAESDFYIRLDFHVPPFPQNRYKIELFLAYSLFDPAYWTNGPAPTIEAYDHVAEEWTTLQTLPENWAYNFSNYSEYYAVSITVDDPEHKLYYTNFDTISLRVYSSYNQKDADSKYYSRLYIYYAAITYTNACQHDPLEFLIDDTYADLYESYDALHVSDDDGVFDFETEKVNFKDKLEILFNDEEWVESVLDTLDSNINAINAPASNVATYGKMNFKLVDRELTSLCERNNWYWYRAQTTTSGKYTIEFKERTSPAAGITVDADSHVDGVDAPVIKYKSVQHYRGVVIKNKDSYGCYGVDGGGYTNTYADIDGGDLPIIVLNRPEIPTRYLETVAQAIFEQNNAITPIVEEITIFSYTGTLEVGRSAAISLCPTTKGDTDYQITGTYVINSIVYNDNGSFTLKLGFDDPGERSVREMLVDTIAGLADSSTL
jgi:hypothetical protein